MTTTNVSALPPVNTHRVEDERGPVVSEQGEIRYLSATTIQKGDPASTGGCPRKWWFRYVQNIPGKTSAGQSLGTNCHKQIEDYLTGDVPISSPIIYPGKHFIPEDDVLVEHALEPGVLTIRDIPVYGNIDCINLSGVHLVPTGAEYKEFVYGCPEVIDWKFLASLDYALDEFLGNTQMVTYGLYVARKWQSERVRLSHVTFQTRGRRAATKTGTIATRDELEDRWCGLEPTVDNLVQIAKTKNEADVAVNPKACRAYGGCEYFDRCGYQKNRVTKRLEARAKNMGILDQMAKDVSVDEALAMLKEKPETKAQECLRIIDSFGKGRPAFTGEAAKFFGSESAMLAGAGDMGALTLGTVAQVEQLVGEIKTLQTVKPAEIVPSEPAKPAEILPPDAPPSDPALAALPLPKDEPKAEETKKRGRPKKEAKTVTDETGFVKVADSATVEIRLPKEATAVQVLFENCLMANQPVTNMYQWIDEACKDLCEQYKNEVYTPVDIRAIVELDYGKWKAALANVVKTKALPGGDCYIDTKFSEIAQIVAEAIRGRFDYYCKGI